MGGSARDRDNLGGSDMDQMGQTTISWALREMVCHWCPGDRSVWGNVENASVI